MAQYPPRRLHIIFTHCATAESEVAEVKAITDEVADEIEGMTEGWNGFDNVEEKDETTGDRGEKGGVKIVSMNGDNVEDIETGEARLQDFEDGIVRPQGFDDLIEETVHDWAKLVLTV